MSAITIDGPARKLLWLSSSRIGYLDVPRGVEESLRAGFSQFKIVVGRDEDTVHREIEDCEIFVSWALGAEQFARCRKLKWIHSPSAGVGQLLAPGVAESNVIVTNGRTVHAVPVAEHAIALLLALARRLGDCFHHQSAGVWGHTAMWEGRHLPMEVNGRTLGLVGLGSIGREIAARARALGMRVVAAKRDTSQGGDCVDKVYSRHQLPAMLAEADYLIIAAPDTPVTRHIVGPEELRRMKPTAFLINIARGTLVDTESLRQALESGTIAGAALDVTDPEPLPPEHLLWHAPNLLISHHMASATDRFWPRQADLLKENLRRYLAGEPLLNLVDKKKGY